MKRVNHLPMPAEPDGPDACFCLAGRRSARFITRIFEGHLGAVGLTSSQFSILSILERYPDITVVELARRMEMDRTTLVRTVRPLKDEGSVVEGREKLGRAVTLHLSAGGVTRLDEGRALWEAAQREFEERVGKLEAARFRELALSVTSHQD
ncbi:MarR family transcriptional regulator [Paraburkholderia sp. 22B1P]|uniref:MarR family winged helix-turn-helix transcriptional regulator n=1 Tax=Paraburkholderia sp. 22B1P TaxID=3080498 RepID=UPI00308D81DD|nr:MarR family transcriptional regulator [Paraburkholderia sp. 22B1P]